MPSSHPDFDRIVQAYRDRYGIDLSRMRMKWSKHPVYNDGRRSYDLDDDETGGSWVNDGTVRINPKMGPVMKRFGIEGMTQAEFRRRLIAHELAHEVWHNQSRNAKVRRLIGDSLAKARAENFTTPYLDTYPADTPKKKFDSELFAEYMSDQLNKKAQAVDHDKWPEYSDYQKRHHDRTIEAVRKIIVDDYTRRGEWGLLTRSGRILGGKDLTDDKVSRAVIRSGMEARRARRANCHELAAAILDKLREKGITARRILVDKDQYNGVPMGHSTVMFQGEDGRWHRATGGMKRGKKSRLGDFDSLEDAIDQYIAVEKANGQTTDDERVEAFDTTDLPFTDRMPWPEYKALARTGRRLYHQEKKAQAYEPPWTIDRIRKNLGDEVADRLAKDPVHRWRSDTGIELVHREPTKKELRRIIANWRLMSDEQKRLSDEKSRELFGVTNEENARRLLGGRRRETWESGEGDVESYAPDRTEDHDEIVIRLNDGRRVRISNNTRAGRILLAAIGSKVGYHGYRIDGTDVVHRVHPNRRSRGGWLERLPDKS